MIHLRIVHAEHPQCGKLRLLFYIRLMRSIGFGHLEGATLLLLFLSTQKVFHKRDLAHRGHILWPKGNKSIALAPSSPRACSTKSRVCLLRRERVTDSRGSI
jgi:hypothetical protein